MKNLLEIKKVLPEAHCLLSLALGFVLTDITYTDFSLNELICSETLFELSNVTEKRKWDTYSVFASARA
jgi:hypothetical protein